MRTKTLYIYTSNEYIYLLLIKLLNTLKYLGTKKSSKQGGWEKNEILARIYTPGVGGPNQS